MSGIMNLFAALMSDPANRPDREELAAFRRPDGGKVWQKRSEQTTIVNALRLLDKHAPAKKGLLTPKPEVECAKLLDESALAADLALAGEILSLDAEARSLLTRASRERASAEAMTPWTALNVPLERMETQSCEMQLGTLPAAVPMEEVNAALSELEVSFDLVSEDKTSRYVSLLFRREDREAIAAALRPLGFSAISLPEGTGTPEQVYNDALRRSEELTAQAAQKIEELASYAPHRDALQLGADTLSTRIAREETAEKLLQSDSTSELPFLQEEMKQEKIDAFNYASTEYGVGSALKDGVKDKLKGMATLGTVRFNTVQTPKYLVLSGNSLHLFDTDTEGEIDRHLVFNQSRLENSRLTEIPMEGQVKAQAQARGNNVKAYKLSLQTDDKPIELIIYSCLIFTNIPEIPTDPQETVQAIVIGNDFLKQLGDRYPNLKVSLPIFS